MHMEYYIHIDMIKKHLLQLFYTVISVLLYLDLLIKVKTNNVQKT